MHWDVVVHGSRQRDGGGVVGEGPEHVQVAGHGAQQVEPQVTESHDGVTEEAEGLEGEDEDTLVLLPFLWQKDGDTFKSEPKKSQDTTVGLEPTLWLLYSALVAVSRMA